MHIKIIEKNELKMYKELGYSIVEIGIPLSFQNITSMINENSIESWEFSVGCVSTPITEKYFSNYKDEMAIYMQKHKDDPFTRQNPCELFELFLSKHTKDLTYTIIKPIYFAKKNNISENLINVKFISPYGTLNIGDIIENSYISCEGVKFDLMNVLLI